MKKEYQRPQSQVVTVAYSGSLMQDVASNIDVPGGGSGTPDTSRKTNKVWDDEE